MKKIILVVDDDASVRESVKKVLAGAGYEVVLAAGGLEAVAHFQSHPANLLLLDLGLPNQNGWETCRHFSEEHPRIPIILMTGQSGQFKSALSAGAAALMEKPLTADQLLHLIHQLLDHPAESDPYRSKGTFFYVAATADDVSPCA
jgi:CheY-like chemotaxis protein